MPAQHSNSFKPQVATLDPSVPHYLSDTRDWVIKTFSQEPSEFMVLERGIEFDEELFLENPDVYILAWDNLIRDQRSPEDEPNIPS